MPETQTRDFIARDCRLRALPGTIDEPARTVDAVLSTEAPAEMHDWWTGRSYSEVLIADGAEFPASRQIPLLDSHSRWSVDDQIGSIRNLRVEDDEQLGRVLVGTLHLDATERGRSAFLKVRDGHLTDMSVGYVRAEIVKLAEGEKQKIAGRDFKGPVEVVTRWPVREASLTPIGADPDAKIRAASRPAPPKERERMPPENMGASQPQAPEAPAAVADPPAQTPEPARSQTPPTPERVDIDRETRSAAEAERRRILEIQEAGRAAQRSGFAITDAEIQAAIENCRTLDQARSDWFALASRRSQNNPPAPIGGDGGGGHIQVGYEQRDSFRAAASDGLLMRAGVLTEEKAHGRAREFAGMGLVGLMRYCFEQANPGKRSHSMTAVDLMGALARPTGYRAHGGTIHCREAFGHSESDFPNVLMDAMHKQLQAGFMESPGTWRLLAIRETLNDLRTRRSAALSEVPSPSLVLPTGEIVEKHLAEKGESYAPATYAEIISISRNVIINDDLNAFARVPTQIGQAFARHINRLFWLKVMENVTMSEDTTAFFHADHGNLAAGSDRGAPSVATLGYMRKQMRTKKGLNDDAILQITPRYLIVPPELYVSAAQVLGSVYDPANTVNQQAINPFSGALTPVEEPELSNTSNANSSLTAWFGAADPMALACFVVGFLNGVETPAVEEHMPFDTLGFKMRAYHDIAVGVIDYRGWFKNPNDA